MYSVVAGTCQRSLLYNYTIVVINDACHDDSHGCSPVAWVCIANTSFRKDDNIDTGFIKRCSNLYTFVVGQLLFVLMYYFTEQSYNLFSRSYRFCR